MSITLSYFAQARQAAGTETDLFDTEQAATIGALVRVACQRRGDDLRQLLLAEDGSLVPWILVSLNGTAVHNADEVSVSNGDVVRLLSPISGG